MAYRYDILPVESNKTNVFKPAKLMHENPEECTVKASQIGAAFMGSFNHLLKGNKRAAVVWEASHLEVVHMSQSCHGWLRVVRPASAEWALVQALSATGC